MHASSLSLFVLSIVFFFFFFLSSNKNIVFLVVVIIIIVVLVWGDDGLASTFLIGQCLNLMALVGSHNILGFPLLEDPTLSVLSIQLVSGPRDGCRLVGHDHVWLSTNVTGLEFRSSTTTPFLDLILK